MLGHDHGERNVEGGTEGGRTERAALVHARRAVDVNESPVVLEVTNRLGSVLLRIKIKHKVRLESNMAKILA
jgi:hypothetical protein